MKRARDLLLKNQYPKSFFEPLIQKTIDKINKPVNEEPEVEADEGVERKKVYIEYRGKITEKFASSLRKSKAPCNVVFTTRKLRSCLLPLKPQIEKEMRSFLVYHITCPRCNASYVGQTMRHLLSRFNEHRYSSSPVGSHFNNCNSTLTIDDVRILDSSMQSIESELMTLEAIHIKDIMPSLNTRIEYKSKGLIIKLS